MPNTYIITNRSSLEPIFLFAQQRDLYMYKTRVSKGNIQWVIEVPPGKILTRFLLEYANSVERIASVYVY